MKGKVENIVSTTKTGRAKTNMDCFHSRDQWALFLTKTKGKESNSRKINIEDINMSGVTSRENTQVQVKINLPIVHLSQECLLFKLSPVYSVYCFLCKYSTTVI